MNKNVVLLGLAAAAAFAFGSKKGKNGKSGNGDSTGTGVNDSTGTLPQKGSGEDAGEGSVPEQEYVNIVLQGLPTAHMLYQDGIDQGVLGINAEGMVTPMPDEWLSGWLSRVAYWGAYPPHIGGPLQLPPNCLLEITCPDDYLPYRAALLRIMGAVKAGMTQRGIQDVRWNLAAGGFGS